MSRTLKAEIYAEYQQAFGRCKVRPESMGLVKGIANRMVDLRSH